MSASPNKRRNWRRAEIGECIFNSARRSLKRDSVRPSIPRVGTNHGTYAKEATLRFSVGLLDALFGEKIQIEVPGQPGTPPVMRTVTKKWFEQMQGEGRIRRVSDSVPVHVLGLAGYELRHWTIGQEVDQASCDQFFDQQSSALYAMVVMRKGAAETYLLAKSEWLKLYRESTPMPQ